MEIWLSHGRLQKSLGQVSLPPKKSCGLLLVRSQAGEGLELLSLIMRIPTEFPCVLSLALSWTFSSSDSTWFQPANVLSSTRRSSCWAGVTGEEGWSTDAHSASPAPSCLHRHLAPLVSEVWGALCQGNQLVSCWHVPSQTGRVQLSHSAKSDTNCPSVFHL